MKNYLSGFCALLALCLPAMAFAQGSPDPAPTPVPAPVSASAPASATLPVPESTPAPASASAPTSVSSPVAVPAQAKAAMIDVRPGQIFQIEQNGVCPETAGLSQSELWINGRKTTLKPQFCLQSGNLAQVGYALPAQLDADSTGIEREQWLGSPWRDARNHFQRNLTFHFDLPATPGLADVTGTLRIQVLKPWKVVGGCVFIFLLVYLMIQLGRRSGMLRDTNPVPVMQRTYSLARVQMAWWFVIVLASYIWLWVVGEDIPVVTTQAMGLLGMSGATGLTASGVDMTKTQVSGQTQGFLYDIMSDDSSLVLYRFQLVIVNILFGLLFIFYVGQHLSMPELDTNVLSLLGISSATYAGFKIPENSGTSAAAAGDPKAGYNAEP